MVLSERKPARSEFDISELEKVPAPITKLLEELLFEAAVIAVYLIDTDGHRIAAVGETESFDITTLGGLFGATESLPRLFGSADFSFVFNDAQDQILFTPLDAHRMLTIVFDERTSVGHVRFQVKRVVPRLDALLSPAKN